MFRLVFVSLIALRVIACPIFCVASDMQAVGVEPLGTCVCACSGSQTEPCQGDEVPPLDSPCPCEMGCVCQITPEVNSRTAVADVQLLLELAPLCLETLDLPKVLGSHYEEHPRRPDLPTGRSVRLAHASLLL